MKSASCSLAQESNFHDFIVHSLVGPKVVMLYTVYNTKMLLSTTLNTLYISMSLDFLLGSPAN